MNLSNSSLNMLIEGGLVFGFVLYLINSLFYKVIFLIVILILIILMLFGNGLVIVVFYVFK